MAKYRSVTIPDVDAVEISAAVDVSDMEIPYVLVGGTFSATYSVEVSLDGVTFFAPLAAPDLAALTTPTFVALPGRCKEVRVNCTAFTSGDIKCSISGSVDA